LSFSIYLRYSLIVVAPIQLEMISPISESVKEEDKMQIIKGDNNNNNNNNNNKRNGLPQLPSCQRWF
jgi:hypothetical protein